MATDRSDPSSTGAVECSASSGLHLVGRSSAPGPSPDEAEISRLRRHLERVVVRVCPGWLAAQVDDLVQTAMLRLLDLVGQGEQGRSFSSAYLYRVAYSALVDEIRRLRRRREVAIEDGEGRPIPIESTEVGPDEQIEASRIGSEIAHCLKRLIRQRRRVVTLHLYGYSAAEAAEILGCRLKQVYNLTHRGLADLRACLLAKGIEP